MLVLLLIFGVLVVIGIPLYEMPDRFRTAADLIGPSRAGARGTGHEGRRSTPTRHTSRRSIRGEAASREDAAKTRKRSTPGRKSRGADAPDRLDADQLARRPVDRRAAAAG